MDDDGEVDDDDDGMSFASRIVYLENIKFAKSWKALRKVLTPKYSGLQVFDQTLLILLSSRSVCFVFARPV